MRHQKRAIRLSFLLLMVCLLATVIRAGSDVTHASGGDPESGRIVYETHCLRCHGKTGRGDGPEALSLEPKPRNFTNPKFWERKEEEEIFLVIAKGGPEILKRHSAMPPFEGILSEKEIRDVMAYERSFSISVKDMAR